MDAIYTKWKSIASQSTRLTIYATETDDQFFNVDYPNHTLVDGVSVNSICQQGGLFAFSVNRHSDNLKFLTFVCVYKGMIKLT